MNKNACHAHKNSILLFSITMSISLMLTSIIVGNNNLIMNPARSVESPFRCSDLPSTYTQTFAGLYPNYDGMVPSLFVNNQAVVIQNSFSNQQRIAMLNLSRYSMPGFSISKVDVNVTKNYVTAINDWVTIENISNDALTHRIYYKGNPFAFPNNYDMLANNITDNYRYEIKNISIYYAATTNGLGIPSPVLEVLNASAGVPHNLYWSAALPENFTAGWYSAAPNCFINAQNAAAKTSFIGVDGSAWGNPSLNTNLANALTWYREIDTTKVDWYQTYSPPTWANDSGLTGGAFELEYEKLYVNNGNNNNLTFTPEKINSTAPCYLEINNTAMNAQGRLSLSGSNMRWLNFTSNTTSARFGVTLQIYYTPNVVANRAFLASGSATVNWNITTVSIVPFPASNSFSGQLNFTKPAGWTVKGVYNASTLAGLSTAANFTKYSVIGNVVRITSIKSSSFWRINCTSTNQISSLVMKVGTTVVTQANVSNTVGFSANMVVGQSTGNLTLGVYYPSAINNSRTFAAFNAALGGKLVVVLSPNWTITKNFLGNYRVQARWNSTTDVGFASTTLVVLGSMNVNLLSINQYAAVLSKSGSTYQGHYGAAVFVNHTIADAKNGSVIVNLAYTYKTNGTSDASGFSSTSSRIQSLPFGKRSVATYNIVVTFQRRYYNNFTATYVLKINPCPAVTNLIQIKQNNANIYKNGTNVYFVNAGSNFTVFANYTNQYTNNLITNRSTLNVTDGSHQYKNSSFTGSFQVSVRSTDLAANVVVVMQAIGGCTNYTTSQATFKIVVDTTPPVTSIAYNPVSAPNFVNVTTSFALTGKDTGSCASGVNKTYYCINGTNWVAFAGNFNLGGYSNGTILLQWYSTDKVGNTGATNSTNVRLDTIAPVTQISYDSIYSNGGKNWISDSTGFTLMANDSNGFGSGVSSMHYQVNGSGWQTYSVIFTLGSSANGTYFIQFYSMDYAGNKESTKIIVVFIDTIAPSTTISYTPVAAPNFVSTSTSFTLTSHDNTGGTGLSSVQFQYTNGSGWQGYVSPFYLSSATNGTVVINYRGIDILGNMEAMGTLIVRLDTISPLTTISYFVAASPDYVNTTTMFTFSPLDNSGGSGIASTQYQYDGSSWLLYSAPFTLALATNGLVTISFRSFERAGNPENVETTTVNLDTFAPTTTISFTPHYGVDYVNSTTQFTISAIDNIGGSGIGNIYYKTDILDWTRYSTPFSLNGYVSGTYTISYYSVDKVGNPDSTHQLVVHLDIIGPTIVISSPTNQTYGTNHVTVILSHSDLDYNASWYTITNMSNNHVIVSNKTWKGDVSEPLTNGTFVMQAWGNDTYGNIKEGASVIFTIDTTAPQIQILLPANATYNHSNLLVEVRNFSRTDAVTFRYNNGAGWSAAYALWFNKTLWVNNTIILADGYYQLQVLAEWGSIHVSRASAWFTIDTTAPVTAMIQPTYLYTGSIPYSKNFTAGGAMFTLTPTDNINGSGVATTYYKVNGGSWVTGTSFSINSYMGTTVLNGTFTIGWYSTDNAGNVENTHHITVYIDSSPPMTTFSYTSAWLSGNNTNWVLGTTVFTAAPGDVGSGVYLTYYKIDSGSYYTLSSPYTFTIGNLTDGMHHLNCYSVDNVGNTQAALHITVQLDTASPTTTISYTSAWLSGNTTNWVLATTQFTLSPSDGSGSGINTVYYQIDANGYNAIGSPYQFTLGAIGDGTHHVYAYSKDNVGNTQALASVHITVQLDTASPTTTISYTSAWLSGNTTNWVLATTQFTLSPSDDSGSGINTVYYQIDANGYNAIGSPYQFTLGAIGDGTHHVYAYSKDNVGNTQVLASVHITVQLDTASPTTTISYTSAWLSGNTTNWVLATTQFTLSPSDGSGSGINTVYYQIDANGYNAIGSPYQFTLGAIGDGTHHVYAYSKDNVGNTQALASVHITVQLDTASPTTTISYTSAWLSGNTTNWVLATTQFTLSPGDAGSGLYRTYYKMDTGSYYTLSNPYTFTIGNLTDGTHHLYCYSMDNLGNTQAVLHITVQLDTMAPATAMAQPTYVYTQTIPYTKNYTTGSATFTLNPTDTAGSGVASTSYRITTNGVVGSWTGYTISFTVGSTVNGTYKIEYYSVDHVGNTETTHSITVFIDAIAPVTVMVQPTYLYNSGSKNFTTGIATFMLTSSDNGGGSGVANTSYRITTNGVVGSWTGYTIPFTVGSTVNGTYKIAYYSIDHAGNTETTHSITVYIDMVAPATAMIQPTYVYTQTIPHTKNFTTGSATFTLNPTDTGGSGVASTSYRITTNGVVGSWTGYTIPFTVGSTVNGTYKIEYYSVDHVGNTETTHSITVYIDAITPVTVMVQPTYLYNSGSKNFTTGSATFTLAPADNAGGSGIMATSYRITANGVAGSWTGYTIPFTLGSAANGTYTIAWNSTDNEGNLEGTHHLTVYIDAMTPVTAITQPTYIYNSGLKNFTTGSATFTLTPVDNGDSGVASTS